MKYLVSLVALLLTFVLGVDAQSGKDLVDWEITISKTKKQNEYIITATAKIDQGWHLFGKNPGDDLLIPTHFEFEGKKIELVRVDEVGVLKSEKFPSVGTIHYYEKEVSFKALVRSMDKNIKGFVLFQACNATMCLPPSEENFSFTLK